MKHSSCCPPEKPQEHTKTQSGHMDHDHCAPKKQRWDYLLWLSLLASLIGLILHFFLRHPSDESHSIVRILALYSHAVTEILSRMWWGLALGMAMVGLLSMIPREFVMSILGPPHRSSGIVRATLAGVLLDLCNHGILLVGLKLYERGASLGQVMAFLIASPWNSLSLTLILVSLVGLKWTLVFVVLSAIIALISGLLFNSLVASGRLPANPHHFDLPADFEFWPEARRRWKSWKWDAQARKTFLTASWSESRMILRWIFFGTVLASLIRAIMPAEDFASYFGPTLTGLGLTLIAATVIEVCSEGSTPLAADLVVRANAPGNGFAFLMTGVSTDYTEILSIKERTQSWKIALFLPLITVPQITVLALILNQGWG